MSDEVRAGEQDRAAVRMFPPAVPVFVVVVGTLLSRRWPLDVGLDRFAGIFEAVGAVILVSAAVLAIWALGLFQRTGQNPEPWKPTPSIIETGPYRLTRNPMYLMMVLIGVGFGLLKLNLWILLLTPLAVWVLTVLVILPEERYLERKFGQGYLSYKGRVRRWI